MRQSPRVGLLANESVLRHLRPGDTIVAGQVLGEPTALLDALFSSPELPDVRLFVGMSLTDVHRRAPGHVQLVSSVGMAPNGQLASDGRMDLIPCHMSDLPWLVTDGPCRADVAAILVSPPNERNECSLGVVSDYIWPALRAARSVIAEINPNVPFVHGDTIVALDRIDAAVHSDRPLPEYARAAPSDLELAIGRHVASFISDGSCLQLGIGRIGEAVLRSIGSARHLGIHAGMVGDTLLEFARDGIVDNSRKAIDTGLTVAGSILGSANALALAAADRNLRLRAIDHTHAPGEIARLDRFVCVNSALEVDVLGQVNAEVAGGRYVGAVGGAVDFLRNSVRAAGGHSIVALPSTTAKGRPRVVATVEHATATRSDVDVVVTEHGIAELRGQSTGERASRLIAVAAPEHRDELATAASLLGV